MVVIFPWDIRVTLDLFFGGVGVGAFLLSVYLSSTKKDNSGQLVRISAYVAPVAVMLGLLFLVTELGRPEKFITTLFRVNPQSVLSIGVYLQTAFVIISLGYAYMLYSNQQQTNNQLVKLIQLIGVPFAIAVGLYHGLLLASVERPLWSELIVPIFFVSSIASGIALVTIIWIAYSSKKKLSFDLTVIRPWLLGLLVMQLIFIGLWHFFTSRAGVEVETVYALMLERYSIYWWTIVLAIGTILPIIVLLVQWYNKRTLTTGTAGVISICILVGVFTAKQIILTIGQTLVPFFNF
ncbi:hypothetical protein BHU72_10225 [Desulfuribacillus stibiiarsenatis]|uniref:Polysulfide reductase n=1 Tax=Desulfuribacillus stibiiarsenatis TaxID=1390249 RepID=A0A1E5L9L2_9FIRM|nr:NrfD/PsrC family molybdoenzyme membrane anchor subunit [Desulfuribacillus stibiiarsenatis]OEH86623.1 hypothetical protein BHU72_10225 [Desulfuribacillus stibiiarsenatis]